MNNSANVSLSWLKRGLKNCGALEEEDPAKKRNVSLERDGKSLLFKASKEKHSLLEEPDKTYVPKLPAWKAADEESVPELEKTHSFALPVPVSSEKSNPSASKVAKVSLDLASCSAAHVRNTSENRNSCGSLDTFKFSASLPISPQREGERDEEALTKESNSD